MTNNAYAKNNGDGLLCSILWLDSRCGLVTLICEKKSVNALPKIVGFLRVLRFPPTGNVDRVG
jgi:hypothetical protein